MRTFTALSGMVFGMLFLPLLAFPQKSDAPFEKKMQMHHEVPGQPWIPGTPGTTSTAYKFNGSGITTVQVNVNSAGENIVGDAANEPSIAVDPLVPSNMVIGWRQFDNVNSNFRQAGWAYTTNNGQSWTFPGVIQPGIFRSDPVLDCDTAGTFYYNSLTSNQGIYTCKVFKSTDNGATWDNGTEAHGGDKQWMVIDRSGSEGNNNNYSNWTLWYSSCMPGHFTRSVNMGSTFEACIEVTSNPYWGTLATGIEGELYIAGSSSWGGLVVVRSTDAKYSFITPSWDNVASVDLDGFLTANISVNPAGLLGQMYVDVDHSSGPGSGNVYVLASVMRASNSDSADVMFSRSTDGGITFSAPVRVNDDIGTSNYQWLGTMSVAPNGRIDAVWLDTRDSPPGPVLSALYYSYSLDQGLTWSANEKMSELFDSHVGWPQQNKMGDYFHMRSDADGAHLAWANTLNGEQDVYYSHIVPGENIQGVNNPQNGFCLKISPNPAKDKAQIRFSLPAGGNISIMLLTACGETVRTVTLSDRPAGDQSVTLPVQGLPAGYYICRVTGGSYTATAGLVKIN